MFHWNTQQHHGEVSKGKRKLRAFHVTVKVCVFVVESCVYAWGLNEEVAAFVGGGTKKNPETDTGGMSANIPQLTLSARYLRRFYESLRGRKSMVELHSY